MELLLNCFIFYVCHSEWLIAEPLLSVRWKCVWCVLYMKLDTTYEIRPLLYCNWNKYGIVWAGRSIFGWFWCTKLLTKVQTSHAIVWHIYSERTHQNNWQNNVLRKQFVKVNFLLRAFDDEFSIEKFNPKSVLANFSNAFPNRGPPYMQTSKSSIFFTSSLVISLAKRC